MFATDTIVPRDFNVLKDVNDTNDGQCRSYRKLRQGSATTTVFSMRTTSYRASTLMIGQVNPQVHLEARLYHAIKPVFANGMPMTQRCIVHYPYAVVILHVLGQGSARIHVYTYICQSSLNMLGS
jgi:hypothetical protein